MPKLMMNGTCYGSNSASDIVYDNATSGLDSTNTKAAIDELAVSVNELNTNLDDVNTNVSEHLNTSSTYTKIRNTSSTTAARALIQGQLLSSNPALEFITYEKDGSTYNNLVKIYFDGTNFYASGKKGGADAVTKKLGSGAEISGKYFSVTHSSQSGSSTVQYALSVTGVDSITITPSVGASHYGYYSVWGMKQSNTKTSLSGNSNAACTLDVSSYDALLFSITCSGRNNDGFSSTGTYKLTFS